MQSKGVSKSCKKLWIFFKFYVQEAKDYQKIFFGFTWQAMLIPFREQKCKAQERMISLYTKFVLTAGTEEDVEMFDYPVRGLPPFYTYFVRNYQNVRLILLLKNGLRLWKISVNIFSIN